LLFFDGSAKLARMDLSDYIRSKGIDKCAASWGVTAHAVKAWLYRDRLPRPAHAAVIVRKTKGEVDYAGIYGPKE
jgi:hypothetical protein